MGKSEGKTLKKTFTPHVNHTPPPLTLTLKLNCNGKRRENEEKGKEKEENISNSYIRMC